MEPRLSVGSRKPAAPLPLTPRGNRKSTLNQPVIAVIDDDPAVCESTKLLLEIYGFSVQTYSNGPDFLNEMPDVACIVVDYMMPDLNGLALIAELRKRSFS